MLQLHADEVGVSGALTKQCLLELMWGRGQDQGRARVPDRGMEAGSCRTWEDYKRGTGQENLGAGWVQSRGRSSAAGHASKPEP